MESMSDLQPANTCSTHHEVGCVFAGLGTTNHSFSASVRGTWIIEQASGDPISQIESIISGYQPKPTEQQAGWLIMLGYELGQSIEPKACAGHDRASRCSDFPLAVIQRWVAKVVDDCSDDGSDEELEDQLGDALGVGGFEIGQLESSMGRAGYVQAVERVKSYISDGDIYQANIAHQLQGSFSGSVRECFWALSNHAQPRVGSMMRFEYRGVRHAVLSISPEVFVEFDPRTRVLSSEPMKGTRPIHSDVAELRDSVKDRAELDMITDLMRNDLGRVCELGSVRVVDPRRIEPHRSGVLQAVSRVEGRLRDGFGIAEIIRGTFPPGSVTGTPKIRAMQVIDELEGRDRNPYCGSMILLDDNGRVRSSVSIRTAHIWGEGVAGEPDLIRNGQFVYSVGAGIVADSDPESEWAETLLKAGILRDALGLDLGC